MHQGKLPIYRALTTTPEERVIRELILQMKLGHVQRGYFQRKFGVDIRERFARPFSQLQEQGYVILDQDSLRLTRDALLQVDRLLYDFFLPQHRNARYA